MDILYFNELESTQIYLIEQLKEKKLSVPVVVTAKQQTAGVGSRDNLWEGGDGNLFFSFAIKIADLPEDLLLNSVSIYFSYIIKEVLEKYTDNIWLKWPNDLYSFKSKIGGIVTKKIDDVLVCGIGINLEKNSNSYEALNINVNADFILKSYINALEKLPPWKQVFSKYKIEFERNKRIYAHIQGKYMSLENAILSKDGSLIINNKRVYSIR